MHPGVGNAGVLREHSHSLHLYPPTQRSQSQKSQRGGGNARIWSLRPRMSRIIPSQRATPRRGISGETARMRGIKCVFVRIVIMGYCGSLQRKHDSCVVHYLNIRLARCEGLPEDHHGLRSGITRHVKRYDVLQTIKITLSPGLWCLSKLLMIQVHTSIIRHLIATPRPPHRWAHPRSSQTPQEPQPRGHPPDPRLPPSERQQRLPRRSP